MLKLDIQLFARKKNALREHYVADYKGADEESGEDTKPVAGDYLRLAHRVTTVQDDSQDNTEEEGDYSGDGDTEMEVTSVTERWTTSGTYDAENPAQALIASKKRLSGDGRKIWHKVVQTDGKVYEGVATLTDIRAGSGDATAFEEFAATINHKGVPKEVVVGG